MNFVQDNEHEWKIHTKFTSMLYFDPYDDIW